jgi:hypothetical protein
MTIDFQGKKIETADSWAAVKMAQKAAIFSVLKHRIPLEVQRVSIFQILTGITDNDLVILRGLCHDEKGIEDGHLWFNAILAELTAETTAFLFDEQKEGYALSPTMYDVPIARLKNSQGELLLPPQSELQNISFYEFTNILDWQFDFRDNEDDVDLLNRIVAILYRPAKPATPENKASGYGGDMRLPLVGYEATLDSRANTLTKIPLYEKQLIAFWAMSCVHRITTQYKDLFTNSQGDGNNYGWAGVMLKLAGGVTQVDAVASQHYETVLIHLDMLEADRQEMERSRAFGRG